MIGFTHRGNFNNTLNFLKKAEKPNYMSILSRYGEIGANALAAATPRNTGESAESWSYTVTKLAGGYRVSWNNSDMAGRVPVVILIQYGHATKNGGFVEGRDFINPALEPVFDQLAEAAWREVNNI